MGQIRDIKRKYKEPRMNKYVRRLISVCRYKKENDCDKGLEPEIGFLAKNVFEHLNYNNWTSRARAAYLLRNIKGAQSLIFIDMEEVYGKLISLMKKENETRLLVSKIALDTYDLLMDDFKANSVFDFDRAIDHRNKKSKNG